MTPPVCGARKRNGEPCRRPAGWGTGHPGTLRCKLHGGKSPNGEKAGARLELLDHAQEWARGHDVSVGDLMLYAVRKAAASAVLVDRRAQEARGDYLPDGERDRLICPECEAVIVPGVDPVQAVLWTREATNALRLSLDATGKAITLRLDERMVRQAEQLGQVIAMAGLEALRAACRLLDVELTAGAQAEYARVIEAGMMSLEAEDLPALNSG